MSGKILLVDDDPEILESFKRLFRKKFKLDTALEATAGLKAVSSNGPYAVVVSDLRMPGMDGIEFLTKVKDIAPDTVRMVLTGNADLGAAIDAVNKGSIFRFLTKPCGPDDFASALSSGIRQYQLVTAERELLEKTLSHSVKVLVDILSIVNPSAFSRSVRLRRYARHITDRFHLGGAWKYKLAALLSQIGCVSIPSEVIEKGYSGKGMTKAEHEMLNSHPQLGYVLLASIPRLEPVAKMIKKQQVAFSEFNTQAWPDERNPVSLGAQILKAVIEFDNRVNRGMTPNKAVGELLKLEGVCNPVMIDALGDVQPEGGKGRAVRQVKINELAPGMILADNIYTSKGTLLAQKGQDISLPMIKLLKNYCKNGIIRDQVRALVSVSSGRETGNTEADRPIDGPSAGRLDGRKPMNT